MKNIRVLALTPIYYPHMGGAERTVDELFSRLSEKNYSIDLVTPNMGGEKLEERGNFRIFRVGKSHTWKSAKFILYQLYQLIKCKKLLKQNKYDFLHIDFAFPASFLALFIKKVYGTKLVTTEFHLGTGMDIIKAEQNPWFVNPIIKKVYQNSDLILVISNEQAKFVKDVSGCDSIVIHQGTDHKKFKPENYDENLKKKFDCKGPVLITVSRLNKRKCINEMIDAFNIVLKKHKDAKLLIVGKGEEKESLEKQIKTLGLENKVIFTGYVSDEDLTNLYATADLFLLTSKYEGFGIANCEALASGTPVITYDTTAASDYIKNGKTGYITKHDPREFAQKVISVLDDKELLESFSKESRKLIEQGYTWEKYADEHDKEFRKWLKN